MKQRDSSIDNTNIIECYAAGSVAIFNATSKTKHPSKKFTAPFSPTILKLWISPTSLSY